MIQKCSVVMVLVGATWLFVVMLSTFMNMSRYVYVLLSCRLFLLSADA